MTTLYIIMLAAFYGYTGTIAAIYGVQTSVSESYYRLPRKLQWIFTLATWGYALPAMFIGLEITGNGLVFLAGSGIAFVGAAPAFHKLGMERTVHTVGAIVGITSMLAFLLVVGAWYYPVLFAVLSLIAFFFDKKNLVWWVETAAFISITLYYAQNILL